MLAVPGAMKTLGMAKVGLAEAPSPLVMEIWLVVPVRVRLVKVSAPVWTTTPAVVSKAAKAVKVASLVWKATLEQLNKPVVLHCKALLVPQAVRVPPKYLEALAKPVTSKLLETVSDPVMAISELSLVRVRNLPV